MPKHRPPLVVALYTCYKAPPPRRRIADRKRRLPVEAPRPAYLEVELKVRRVGSRALPPSFSIAAVKFASDSRRPATRSGWPARCAPSHDLARNESPCGATGGAGAGWHLKLPARTTTKRTEMRAPTVRIRRRWLPAESRWMWCCVRRDQPVQRSGADQHSPRKPRFTSTAPGRLRGSAITAWSAGAFHAAGTQDNSAEQQWREWNWNWSPRIGTADTKHWTAGQPAARCRCRACRPWLAGARYVAPNGPPADQHRAVSEQSSSCTDRAGRRLLTPYTRCE